MILGKCLKPWLNSIMSRIIVSVNIFARSVGKEKLCLKLLHLLWKKMIKCLTRLMLVPCQTLTMIFMIPLCTIFTIPMTCQCYRATPAQTSIGSDATYWHKNPNCFILFIKLQVQFIKGNLCFSTISMVKAKEDILVPEQQRKVVRQRRRRIPDRPNTYFNIWALIKNSIGKDLTKMPIPVNFSEPLSMLQRLTESDLEYSDLLDKAAEIQDDCEQVSATCHLSMSHSITSYTSTCLHPDGICHSFHHFSIQVCYASC